jgi:hypothetical protein
MTEIMIDIETLDVVPTAVILEIGIAAFDGHEVTSQKLIRPSVPKQIEDGRTIKKATWDWWARQKPKTRDRVMFDPSVDCRDAASELLSFCLENGMDNPIQGIPVWSRGPQFDIVIIENFLAALDFRPPWHYSSIRDVRTIVDDVAFQRQGALDPIGEDEAHNALADCAYQIRTLNWARSKLGAMWR